ncbi:hypothetical protein NSK_003585 [Nannochloropsis salina CCMP1776]|uniref:Cytochrome b-c1 complex subunit Rieske, mitochondrial n=1 Tax=Nannochloropsis salina CCMP1776 TaxID=1027361 RepID=A0A4D9D0N0_9STRA|nr:hypothetical protein NSK_003585 [Nannochloropsis salina CCMP1776]|eukprot:TFJ85162.1 hypothetical protein NSK_003585 [Nannochloropsis salina CCMP1776]
MFSKFVSSGLSQAAARTSATTWVHRGSMAAVRHHASQTSSGPVDKMESFDNYYEKDKLHKKPGDPNKRDFTYFVLGGARFIYASAARLVALKFVSTMSASADVLALANAEFDIGDIPLGQGITVKWRGKPIFIRHRTPAEIERETAVNMNELRDAEPDAARAQQPEWLIIVGICTHLGCVPIANAGDYHGWFCPCHGSHYDVSGRIRKGPAPLNMEIPPYKFLTNTKVLIG